MGRKGIAVASVLLAVAATAWPQMVSRYEALYGTPVEVSIQDLVMGGGAYLNRAVRTRGFMQPPTTMSAGSPDTVRTYFLRDHIGNTLLIVPVPDIQDEWNFEAMGLLGRELEVTGLFATSSDQATTNATGTGYVIQFWGFVTAPDRKELQREQATALRLPDLVSRPGEYDGKPVRVVGLFRGKNLFGDLPSRSQKDGKDWVIKDDLHAVWITGKKPQGKGWRLDPGLKRDTAKWIEVVGRPITVAGITYIRADQLALSSEPKTAVVEATPAPPALPPPPKEPPVVVFSLPLDGEESVPGDSRFVIQFSKDMDATTFKGHVEVRYLEPEGGLKPLRGLTMSYDGGRKALTIDPGDVLGRGAELEVRLLPGIKDTDGLELVPRGATLEGAVDILAYQIAL